MDYYGLGFNTQLDVTEMDFLHIDIYSDQAGTLGIVPIWWNAEANANFPEIRSIVNYSAGEWSSIDIPMSDFEDVTRGDSNLAHQLKLDYGNGANILIDNIFFWKERVTAVTDVKVSNVRNNGIVYSIDGRIVKTGATDLSGLTGGIYIFNGKKVLVK